MRSLVNLAISIFALTGSYAVCAQDVLDRVEPTRLEERAIDTAQTKIEVPTSLDSLNADAVHDYGTVFVGAIEIVGLAILRNSDFSDIVQGFIGRPLSSSDLASLSDALASRARRRFPLATARVEPQAITGGVLRVHLDEGRVDGVELAEFRNERVEKVLNRLITGQPVTVRQLESTLLLARDVEGVAVRATTIRREGDRNILIVRGAYSRYRGQLTIDNDTIEPIGPIEAIGMVQTNGLLSHDDSLQAYILTALPQPEELAFARVRYSKRLDNAGTELSVAGSYSRSVPGSYLAPLEIVSRSSWASVGASRPLLRSVRRSMWLDGSLSWRELKQDRANRASRLDRLFVGRARLVGSATFAGGILQSSATVSQGLSAFDSTRSGSTMASRPDADSTFTAILLSANWSRKVVGNLGMKVTVRSQLASAPLLISEEIGLGGASFARGYDYNERSGDQGTMGYVEINHAFKKGIGPLNGVKPYAFVDGGKVTNLRSGSGGGSLFSAGGGIQFDVDPRTDAAIEFAAPLSGARYESNTTNPRIRVSLTRYF